MEKTAPKGGFHCFLMLCNYNGRRIARPYNVTLPVYTRHWTQWHRPFDTYIETQLAPVLDPGTVVILDNLSTHKSPRAAKALRRKAAGSSSCRPTAQTSIPPLVDCLAINCRAVIEMAFSKLKAHLRRIGARPFDALFDALEHICNLFKPEECWNVLKAAGYASD